MSKWVKSPRKRSDGGLIGGLRQDDNNYVIENKQILTLVRQRVGTRGSMD